MAETPQLYRGLESGSSQPDTGLRGVINYIRGEASSQKGTKGNAG